jgi:hypothetical protein
MLFLLRRTFFKEVLGVILYAPDVKIMRNLSLMLSYIVYGHNKYGWPLHCLLT